MICLISISLNIFPNRKMLFDNLSALNRQPSAALLCLCRPAVTPAIFPFALSSTEETPLMAFRKRSIPEAPPLPAFSIRSWVWAASPRRRSSFCVASSSSEASFCTSAVLSGFIRAASSFLRSVSTWFSRRSYSGSSSAILSDTACISDAWGAAIDCPFTAYMLANSRPRCSNGASGSNFAFTMPISFPARLSSSLRLLICAAALGLSCASLSCCFSCWACSVRSSYSLRSGTVWRAISSISALYFSAFTLGCRFSISVSLSRSGCICLSTAASSFSAFLSWDSRKDAELFLASPLFKASSLFRKFSTFATCALIASVCLFSLLVRASTSFPAELVVTLLMALWIRSVHLLTAAVTFSVLAFTASISFL